MRLIHSHGNFGNPPGLQRNILVKLARGLRLQLKTQRNRIKMSGKIGFHSPSTPRRCGILKNDREYSRTVSQHSGSNRTDSQNSDFSRTISQNSDYSLPSITTISTVSFSNTHSDVSDISADNITLDSVKSRPDTEVREASPVSDKCKPDRKYIGTSPVRKDRLTSPDSAKRRSDRKNRDTSPDSEIHDSSLPRPMPQVSRTAMRFLSPSSSRSSVRSLDSFKCPCCLRLLESPRLLGCLHNVCTPCLYKIESLLRSYEKQSKKSVHWENKPLGKFLCPLCNSLEVIPRQGICLIPVNIPVVHSMSRSRNHSHPSPGPALCADHANLSSLFCLTCNVTLCPSCVEGDHRGHSVDQVERVTKGFGEALENAVKEISERMKVIENGIGKIKAAREAGRKEKRELRKAVQTYYEGYVQEVRKHTDRLEEKIREHQSKNFNMLLKEELQLEQYKDDLNLLCNQIDLILKSKSNLELAKFIIPVAKRLKVISNNIMNTGEAITDRLGFIPRSISDTDIPGILSTFTINQNNSHLILDRPIYEKVICSIQLILMDQNGMRLEVYRDLDVTADMTVFKKDTGIGRPVDVSFERGVDRSTWQLSFTPPYHGIAQLSVTIDGIHIKNSPYVINVRKLFLDTSFLSRSNSKQSKVTRINV